MSSMPVVQIVSSEFSEELRRLVRSAERRLIVCAPFITRAGTSIIEKQMRAPFRRDGELLLVTDCSATSVQNGSLDLQAVRDLLRMVGKSRIVHVQNLHAKAFIADSTSAILTSANLTTGGIKRNMEMGTVLRDATDVSEVLRKIDRFVTEGREVEPIELEALMGISNAVKPIVSKPQGSVERAFRRILRPKSEGKSSAQELRWVFAPTILSALARSGPMWLRELEKEVRTAHPALCDDTKRRAVAKKIIWRHEVAWALHELKLDNQVVHMAAKRKEGRWALPQTPAA